VPDFPRAATAKDVWEYPKRTLTEFKGQPRIDLLGEDASFEDGTGPRLTYIDRLANIEALRYILEGTAGFSKTDTYPKSVVIIDTSTTDVAGKLHLVEAYIDLSPLQTGESVTIREYMKIWPDGDFLKYAEETYTGPQSLPLLHVISKPARYGLKLEIAMDTAPSVDKVFRFQLFIKSVK